MHLDLNPRSINDYSTFKKVKGLPVWSCHGRRVWFPDEYAEMITGECDVQTTVSYQPSPFLQDHQAAIAALSIQKERFCVFADCGIGKTLIFLEFAHTVHDEQASQRRNRILIVSPLMVVSQTIAESQRFYGDSWPLQQVRASELMEWLHGDEPAIGITNFEAIAPDIDPGNLGGLIIDESSMLKSHYGKWGTRLIELGRGVRWKLALTGTPAPNDRMEYANHAVFVGRHPNTNAFLAKYFVNRGQTQERWVLKPHAVKPFYREMTDWSIFVANPALHGWSLDTTTIPPIHIHIEHVDLTKEQRDILQKETGNLFTTKLGGIVSRSVLSRIARGTFKGKAIATNKYDSIITQVQSWSKTEQTIIWCQFNDEQREVANRFGDTASSISGDTPVDDRLRIIEDFKSGRIRVLISKPKILGFGLNLQCATRQVFSGINDSYESFYQAVKRSNRFGSTKPLNVHVPVTEIERPLIENVLRKADAVKTDSNIQEKAYHDATMAISK